MERLFEWSAYLKGTLISMGHLVERGAYSNDYGTVTEEK